jgi:hypothetical protein
MAQGNLQLSQYMETVATSRQIILSAFSLLSQQETNLATIMNNSTRTIPETIPETIPIWQSIPISRPAFERRQQNNQVDDNFVELSEVLTQTIMRQLNRSRTNIGSLLTGEQITNSTETMLFSELHSRPNIDIYYSCPISFENFVDETEIIRLRQCGHYFGRDSIMRWLNINTQCPMCRYDLRNNDRVESPRPNSGINDIPTTNEENTQGVTPEIDNSLAGIIGTLINGLMNAGDQDPGETVVFQFEVDSNLERE